MMVQNFFEVRWFILESGILEKTFLKLFLIKITMKKMQIFKKLSCPPSTQKGSVSDMCSYGLEHNQSIGLQSQESYSSTTW